MAVAKRTIASQTVAQRYLLTRELGSGTYGDVYLANDLELDRQVAIKVLREEYAENEASVQRFLREARYAARVPPHPNIVTVFDLVRDGELLCIILEYVEGLDLRGVIAASAPLPLAQAVSIMEGMLSALAAAHNLDIIHRDVKPANVLLDKMKRVKLTDFGIAQALMESDTSGDDGIPGTAAYMSPEQIRNEPVGVGADLYAAGVILFEMLTGRRLFVAETSLEVALKHLRESVPTPRSLNPAIPVGVEAVILRALEKDWHDRYTDAHAMMEALRAATATRGKPAVQIVHARSYSSRSSPKIARDAGGNPPESAPAHTEILPGIVSPAPGIEERMAASEQRHSGQYEPVLRALGALLDQEPSDHITLMEVENGFFLRRQRALNTITEVVAEHVTLDSLKTVLVRLQQERPRGRRVRHIGLWSSFPQGHQDFFRALGHELDAISARALVIDQDDDSLTMTYQRPRRDGTCCEKHLTVLYVEQIEQIINAAFERRHDPRRRLGLDRVEADHIQVGVDDDPSS